MGTSSRPDANPGIRVQKRKQTLLAKKEVTLARVQLAHPIQNSPQNSPRSRHQGP